MVVAGAAESEMENAVIEDLEGTAEGEKSEQQENGKAVKEWKEDVL